MRNRDESKITSSISTGRRAFTLAELVVSLAVMIILLGITGMIYKSASDAMNLNNALVTVAEDNRAFTQQVDLTLGHINTDGYLVIYGYDVRRDADIVEKIPGGKIRFDQTVLPSVRSDAICFFTSGSFTSQVDNNVSANTAWVYIGHAGSVTPSSYGSSPFDAHDINQPLVANHWVLSKYMILLAPGQAGTYAIPSSDIRNTFIDTAGHPYDCTIANYMRFWMAQFSTATLQNIRNWFYINWIYDYVGLSGVNPPNFGTPPVINFDATNPLATFPYTIPNCGSFKVEFVMPKSYFNTDTVFYSDDEPDTYADGTLVWRDAIHLDPDNPNDKSQKAWTFDGKGTNPTDPTATHAVIHPVNAGALPPLGNRNDHQMAVFGPKDVWPLMIKFTLRKYDESLTITSEEKFDTGATLSHGGQTFEYIYKLPDKN